MKTPTHALIGHACVRLFRWHPGSARLVIVGAVAPDLPLAIAWTWVAAAVTLREGQFSQPAIQAAFDPIYFSNGWVSSLHNLLHSPTSLALLAALAAVLLVRARRWRERVFAFLAGALTHALADILSHVGDGPLVLWPLETTLRIDGPFSHWNPNYGGVWCTALEITIWALWCLTSLRKRGPVLGRARGRLSTN